MPGRSARARGAPGSPLCSPGWSPRVCLTNLFLKLLKIMFICCYSQRNLCDTGPVCLLGTRRRQTGHHLPSEPPGESCSHPFVKQTGKPQTPLGVSGAAVGSLTDPSLACVSPAKPVFLSPLGTLVSEVLKERWLVPLGGMWSGYKWPL